MKTISLTQGKEVTVDDSDYEELSQYHWSLLRCRGVLYAARYTTNPRKAVLMHRHIMRPDGNLVVDHINHNGLDNQRANLRVCTRSENQRNRVMSKNNSTGFKGVCFDKQTGMWMAFLKERDRFKNLGRYADPKSAAEAYDAAASTIFGEYALTNQSLGIL